MLEPLTVYSSFIKKKLLKVNDGYGIFTMNYYERKKSGEADG